MAQQQEDVPLPALTGRDVRLIRQVRGLRQADVAKRSGLSVTKLSFLENGRHPITPGIEVRLVRVLWP